MAQKITRPAAPVRSSKPKADARPAQFVFQKENYTWFIIAVAVVAFGFFLMAGTTDIYSTTKIVIAPLVVLGGFGLGFYAIFKKPAVNS